MSLYELAARERKVCSQNGEDGVIEALFETLGVTNRYFVEFGVGDATECNTVALLEQGWRGLMMDAWGVTRVLSAPLQKEFVSAENINQLFAKYGVPRQFDLLSIDVDGNDFWIWAALDNRPRVVVIEYNATPGPQESRTIVYDPYFYFQGTDYFGASLLALQKLARLKSYTLVYCDTTGNNAFFVADEALPVGYQAASLGEIYRPPNYLGYGLRWIPDPVRKMIDPFCGWNAAFFRTHVGWWPKVEIRTGHIRGLGGDGRIY